MIFKLNDKLMLTIFTACFLFLSFLSTSTVQIFANDAVVTTPISGIIEQPSTTTISDYAETGELPSVSVEQAADFIGGKLYDVILFLQVIAKPACIVVGAISVMMALVGVFGDSGLLMRGITGLIIAALCYFGIMFAPEIIAFINGWFAEGTEVFTSTTLP